MCESVHQELAGNSCTVKLVKKDMVGAGLPFTVYSTSANEAWVHTCVSVRPCVCVCQS